MWKVFLVLFAVLMFLGGIFNLFDKDPNYSMGAFGVGVGIICGGAFLYARRSQKERLSFLEWLIENRQSLIDGVTALYKGIPISITSELVTYQSRSSFIFYTVNFLHNSLSLNMSRVLQKIYLLFIYFFIRVVGIPVWAYLYNPSFI